MMISTIQEHTLPQFNTQNRKTPRLPLDIVGYLFEQATRKRFTNRCLVNKWSDSVQFAQDNKQWRLVCKSWNDIILQAFDLVKQDFINLDQQLSIICYDVYCSCEALSDLLFYNSQRKEYVTYRAAYLLERGHTTGLEYCLPTFWSELVHRVKHPECECTKSTICNECACYKVWKIHELQAYLESSDCNLPTCFIDHFELWKVTKQLVKHHI